MRVWIPSLVRDTTFLTTATMALLFCSEIASTPFTPMTWSSHSPFHLFLIDTSATGSSSNYPLSPTAKALLSASFGGVYAKAPRERYDVGFWAFYYSMLLRFGLVSGLTGNESQRIFSCNNNRYPRSLSGPLTFEIQRQESIPSFINPLSASFRPALT